MRADAESSCIALCTDSWRHWLELTAVGAATEGTAEIMRVAPPDSAVLVAEQIDRPELDRHRTASLLGARLMRAAHLRDSSRAGWLVTPVTLRRFYLLFFIDIEDQVTVVLRRDHRPTPDGVWTTQAARNPLIQHGHQLADAASGCVQALGASQFIERPVDGIGQNRRVCLMPHRDLHGTPVANAFAERWIGTLRRELLDRTIIWNRRAGRGNNLVVDYDRPLQHAARPHRSSRSATTRRHRRCRPAQTGSSKSLLNGPLWRTGSGEYRSRCRLTKRTTGDHWARAQGSADALPIDAAGTRHHACQLPKSEYRGRSARLICSLGIPPNAVETSSMRRRYVSHTRRHSSIRSAEGR